MHEISFPGLSLGPFILNHTAISVGSIEVRWYGIIIMLGIFFAFFYAAYRAKQNGVSFDDMLDYVIFTVPVGIICARLYFVLTNVSDYKTFYDVIAIWNGGLAIYGGVIGGAITICVVSKIKKIKMPLILDCAAPGVMMAQAMGRWGNFFNAEAYGILGKFEFFGKTVKTPLLGDDFILRMLIGNPDTGKTVCVHPTFFYESLWNVIGFVLINKHFSKRKFDGEIALMYAVWYGFGRFFIEGLRGDSLYVGSFRISQLFAFICVIAGTALIIILRNKAKKNDKALDAYIKCFDMNTAEEVHEKAADAESIAEENDDSEEKE